VEPAGLLRAARAYLIFFGLALCLSIACRAQEQLFEQSHAAMGTSFKIYLYAANQERASELFSQAFDEIDRIEEALSNYRSTSELSRINRLAGKEAVVTDPEVFALLKTSLDYSARSKGAFDITVGPLMRAWGFFRGQGHYPSAQQLAAARASIGWQYVKLDSNTRSVRFSKPRMELDLGGIGKGYAADRVADLLREAGVKAALIDAGSSTLMAVGAPPGTAGWKVVVPKPGQRSTTISTVFLRDESLSTSGSYEKFFRLQGNTYCQIMDPRTGRPVQQMLQTSVVAPNATETDALSTTMFVLGPRAGEQLLAIMPEAQALWVTPKGNAGIATVVWHWRDKQCGGGGCGLHVAANAHEINQR
jgi:thiamine biosynthesis lipoprotein